MGIFGVYFVVVSRILEKPQWKRSFLVNWLVYAVNSCKDPFWYIGNFGRIFSHTALVGYFFKKRMVNKQARVLLLYIGKTFFVPGYRIYIENALVMLGSCLKQLGSHLTRMGWEMVWLHVKVKTTLKKMTVAFKSCLLPRLAFYPVPAIWLFQKSDNYYPWEAAYIRRLHKYR